MEKTLSTEDLDTPIDEKLLMGDEEPAETQEEAVEAEETVEAKEEIKEEVKEEQREEQHIPKARFNEVNERRKELEEEVAQLRAMVESKKEPSETPQDLSSLRAKESEIEEQIEEALYDGDRDKIKELRGELRQVRGKIDSALTDEAERRAEERITRKQEQNSFAETASKLEEKYPILNSETGDKKAINMVIALRDSYIAKGMSLTKALVTAVEEVAPLFVKPEASKDEDIPEDPRKKNAILRGVETSNKTPPQGGGVGNRAQELKQDRKSVSQSEWERMSESEREAMLAA